MFAKETPGLGDLATANLKAIKKFAEVQNLKMITIKIIVFVLLASLARPEETSVMRQCGMINRDLNTGRTFNSEAICDGGFKSIAQTTATDVGGGKKELVTVLKEPKKIVSAFVQNSGDAIDQTKRMGESALFIGEDTGPFSAGMEKCTADFYDSGVYSATCSAQGKYAAVRRNGLPSSSDQSYVVSELRLYQTPNLLERPGVTISAPQATMAKFGATNLINNFSRRSIGNDLAPLVDKAGGTAAWKSCFKTGEAQLTQLGNKLELQINLGDVYFQHAVLVVQDLFSGWKPLDMDEKLKFFQNYEIYIGNSPNFASNPKCPGGPFMVDGDPNSTVHVSFTDSGGYVGPMWKFGHEVWCNMEGQFITIVADLSSLAGKTSAKAPNGYEMSICHLAVFGTRYKRNTPVPAALEVISGTSYTLEVEKIKADSQLQIGNTLNIMLRQNAGSRLSWVSITQDVLVTKVIFAPDSSVSAGVYNVLLESFDLDGGVLSTLKKDRITVKVLPAECGLPFTHKFKLSQQIFITQEYEPTIYFPEKIFSGPHTHQGYTCGGTYTQAITIDRPASGIVITDQTTSADPRPRMEIGPTVQGGVTFALTFSGRYQYAPTATDISDSFTQTYRLRTVFYTDFLDLIVDISSYGRSDLTVTVPVATASSPTPKFSFDASRIRIKYDFKAVQDSLGNMPPALQPAPFSGITSQDVVLNKSVGTTYLSNPKGVLVSQSFTGSLPASTIELMCNPWTVSTQGTTRSSTVQVENSVNADFKKSFDFYCDYQRSTLPAFATSLSSVPLTVGIAKAWTLPSVVDGSLPPTFIRLELSETSKQYLSLNSQTRTVSYNGISSGPGLSSTELTYILIDSVGQEKAFTQSLRLQPIECGMALSQGTQFKTSSVIIVIIEYEPTIYFPEKIFSGPHTHQGYTCGGAYTQAITIDRPASGIVITDQPTPADPRPRVEIGPTVQGGVTFALTFSGRYQYAPTATDISDSFTQTYRLRTVFQTDLIDQPRISHKLTSADLTFSVPPDSYNPLQSLSTSSFNTTYDFKSDRVDQLGNIPPAIVPVPYSGFVNAITLKKQLGKTFLTSPPGELLLEGESESAQSFSSDKIKFTCDVWSESKKGSTVKKTLRFVNSVNPNFTASLDVFCSYQAPPNFAGKLPESETVKAGTESTWLLPQPDAGQYKMAALSPVEVYIDQELRLFLSFNPDNRKFTWSDLDRKSVSLVDRSDLKVVVTLTNEKQTKAFYTQKIIVLHPENSAPVLKDFPVGQIFEVRRGTEKVLALPQPFDYDGDKNLQIRAHLSTTQSKWLRYDQGLNALIAKPTDQTALGLVSVKISVDDGKASSDYSLTLFVLQELIQEGKQAPAENPPQGAPPPGKKGIEEAKTPNDQPEQEDKVTGEAKKTDNQVNDSKKETLLGQNKEKPGEGPPKPSSEQKGPFSDTAKEDTPALNEPFKFEDFVIPSQENLYDDWELDQGPPPRPNLIDSATLLALEQLKAARAKLKDETKEKSDESQQQLIDNRSEPPKAELEISSIGEVRINFDQDMDFDYLFGKYTFETKTAESKRRVLEAVKGASFEAERQTLDLSSIVDAYIVRGDEYSAPYPTLGFEAKMVDYTPRSIGLKMTFSNPLSVSFGEKPDVLVIKFPQKELFVSVETAESPLVEQLQQILPKQYPDPEQLKLLESTGKSVQVVANVAMGANLALTICLSLSLKAMWNMVHVLQIIVFLPNVFDSWPANTLSVFKAINDAVKLKPIVDAVLNELLSTEELQSVKADKETEFGVSRNILISLGIFFVAFVMIVALIVVYCVLQSFRRKVKQCCQKLTEILKRKLFFSSFIRYFIESSLQSSYTSLFFMYQYGSFETQEQALQSSVRVFLLGLMALWLIFATAFPVMFQKKLRRKAYRERFGSMYDGIVTRRVSAILYTSMFCLRRYLLVVFLALWKDNGPLLVQAYLALYTCYFWYLVQAKPNRSGLLNTVENANEILLMVLHYLMLFFLKENEVTPENQWIAGHVTNGVLVSIFLLNLSYLVNTTCRKYKENLAIKRAKAAALRAQRIAKFEPATPVTINKRQYPFWVFNNWQDVEWLRAWHEKRALKAQRKQKRREHRRLALIKKSLKGQSAACCLCCFKSNQRRPEEPQTEMTSQKHRSMADDINASHVMFYSQDQLRAETLDPRLIVAARHKEETGDSRLISANQVRFETPSSSHFTVESQTVEAPGPRVTFQDQIRPKTWRKKDRVAISQLVGTDENEKESDIESRHGGREIEEEEVDCTRTEIALTRQERVRLFSCSSNNSWQRLNKGTTFEQSSLDVSWNQLLDPPSQVETVENHSCVMLRKAESLSSLEAPRITIEEDEFQD